VTSTPHPAGDPWPGGCPVPAAAPEGAFNFRDLGGARTVDGRQVRRGLVYRCGALDGLPCAGWDAVADLGVRTVFDLRAAHERTGQATGAVRVGVDVVQIPMWENGEPGTTLPEPGVLRYRAHARAVRRCIRYGEGGGLRGDGHRLCTRFRRGHRGVVGTGNAAGV